MPRHYHVIIAPLYIAPQRNDRDFSRWRATQVAPVLFSQERSRGEREMDAQGVREVNSKELGWLRGMASVKLPVRIWLSKVRLLSRKLLYGRCGSRLPLPDIKPELSA